MDFSYEDFVEGFFSDNAAITGRTTTAATTSSLSDWSLDIGWDCDYRDLIESMAGDDEGAMLVSPPTLPTQRVALAEEPSTTPDVSKGQRLVHLLLAAAESSTGGNKTRELTRVILERLKDLVLVSPHSGHQTNMERLAVLFTNGLSKLLELGPPHQHQHHDDVYTAFQSLQNMSPYVNFGYLTATQAIIEAVKDERRIHIVDYDIAEGVQWASLIQTLASGPSVHHLRITAVSRPTTNGKKSVAAVQEAGRRLTAFAESISQPFSFHHCELHNDTFITPTSSSLHLIIGEALVVNCVLHLPRFTHQTLLHSSVVSFLSEAKKLNPKLVTLVHEEIGMTGNRGFGYRFMDVLHQFSAMLDSLEAGPARGFVERVYVAPWVYSWLTRITASAHDDAEAESFATWPRWLESNGFVPVEVSFANRCQAKLLLSLFSNGYIVEALGQNGLVLGWKSRRLVSASFWAYRDEFIVTEEEQDVAEEEEKVVPIRRSSNRIRKPNQKYTN